MSARARQAVVAIFCLAALLAWGVGAGRETLAAALGALVVAGALSPYRLHSQAKAKSRMNDLTFVVIVASALWYYLQRQTLQTNLALHLLSLCPVFLYPKLLFNALQGPDPLAGRGSSRDGVAIARRWLDANYGFSRQALDRRRSLSFETIYYLIALFIATLSLPWRAGIGVALAGCLAHALFHGWNPKLSAPRSVALGLCACAIALGGAAAGGMAIERGQELAEDYVSQLYRRADTASSANSTDTAIGRRGRIDNGNRLLLRVDWPLPRGYLRNGVFSYTPNGTTWFAASPAKPGGERALFPADGNSFVIGKPPMAPLAPGAMAQAKISTTFGRDRAAIALPIGTTEIFGLPLAKIEINDMGVPSSSGSQGFVKFGVTFAMANDQQPQPTDADLDVPLALHSIIDAFVAESQAKGLPPQRAAETISAYFKAHWKYTLDLEASDGSPRSLSRFLRRDRQGHCEYFASATTLALRRLGIPARYDGGFLVSEFDAREKLFWVRSSDAHAWSSYWDGSQWRIADSTPGGPPEPTGWANAGIDWFSRIQYMLEEFDPAALTQQIDTRYVWALAFLALCYGAYRIRLRKGPSTADASSAQSEALSARIQSLTGLARLPTEASCDYWRRAAPLLERPEPVLDAAAAREAALFTHMPDQDEALATSERLARLARSSAALAKAKA